VSISGGVATTVWKGEGTEQQLIAAADRMLYEAKRQGRKRMVAATQVAA
jgi:PleD family two-component response regulator